MKNEPLQPLKPFTGTVDELLDHMNNIDDSKVESDINEDRDVLLSDGEAITQIMEELKCDRTEAEKVLMMVKEEEVKNTLNNLMSEGLVEISRYDADGEPLYSLTDAGKNVAENLKKDDFVG